MNADIQRTFVGKLLVLGLITGSMSFFLVRPKSLAASELESQFQIQSESIALGERNLEQHADLVSRAIIDMRAARDAMLDDLALNDAEQSHQLLQRTAIENGLTVTRVEPLQSILDDVQTGSVDEKAAVEKKQFRLECNGTYSGVVDFIQEMQQGPRLAQIESFRMMPTSEQSVRAIMYINLLELVEYPQQLRSELGTGTTDIDHSDTQEAKP